MAGLLNRIREMSDEAEQAKIARRKESAVTPDLLSGSVKMIAGGLGAVPTAVGRAIEQIPTGVGKLIGGVPINPPDYAVNQPLDLAVQGAKEFGTGLSDVGTALRGATMNVFGLKEAPAVTTPAQPFAGGVPKPVGIGRTFGPEVAPDVGKKTREQFTKDIEATRVEPTAVPVPEGRGIAGRITMGGPEGENITEVKRGITPARDFNAEIDDLVNQLMSDPSSRKTQTMSGGWVKTGGLKKSVGDQIVELKKAQLGLAGHEITAEASKAGHKATAEAAMDWRNASLEERKRQNDILANQHTLAREQQKDIASQKAMETVLNRFAVHESDPLNPTDKTVNMRNTYFNVWDSGTKPHSAIADAVNQMGDQWKEYLKETMKLSKLGKLTPEQEKQIKARFRKSLSLFPDIAPVK